jgi:hypothetical protein
MPAPQELELSCGAGRMPALVFTLFKSTYLFGKFVVRTLVLLSTLIRTEVLTTNDIKIT